MENYFDFINNCKLKNYVNTPVHRHHILPRHMGGLNTLENIVILSVEDHYTAHILLSECFESSDSRKRSNLSSAIMIKRELLDPEKINEYRESLKGETNPNFGKRWSFSKKEDFAKRQIITMNDPLVLVKMRKPKKDSSKMGKHDKKGIKNPFFGKTHSIETKEKLAKAHTGVTPSNARKVEIENTCYKSLADASNKLGIKTTTIWHRVKSMSEKYKNYNYI